LALQYSTGHRTNSMTDIVTDLGSTSYLLIYTGSAPANCAASATGTLLASLPCSSTFGTVSSGVLTANAITAESAVANGTAGYWRLCTDNTGATCIVQGLAYGQSSLSTNASTTSGAVLPFAATSPIVAGQTVSGSNIPANTYALDVGSTSVTLNQNITGTVGSGASITFGGDLTLVGGAALTASETVTVSNFVITASGA
jgi:hypothetical protein